MKPPRTRAHTFKLLFRGPQVPAASEQQMTQNLARYFRFFFRVSPKAPEIKKSEPGILQALSKPPSFNASSLKHFFGRTKLYLQFFFNRRSKENVKPTGIAKFYDMSLAERMLYDLRKSLGESRFLVLIPIQRYWKKALLLIAIAPIIFEIFLQGASLLAWSMLQLRSAIVPPQKEVVLCIGDSYTSGRFTSSQIKPYPDYLREMTHRQVVNYSSAFLNSVQVLENLPGLLEKQQPALVYVMVGINDFLDSDTGPILRRRLPAIQEQRYIRTALIFKNVEREPLVPAILDTFIAPAPFFLKTPDEDKRSVDFSETALRRVIKLSSPAQKFPADTRFYYRQGSILFGADGKLEKQNETLRYMIKGNLLIEQSSALQEVRLWQWNNGVIALSGNRIEDINLYSQKQTSLDPLVFNERTVANFSAWDELESGALEQAKATLAEESRKNDDVFFHAAVAELDYKTGLHDEARKQIAWLLSKYETQPDPKTARALLMVFGFENSVKDSLDLSIALLKQYPTDPWIWEKFGWYSYLCARPDFAARAINQALNLAPAELPGMRASLLRTQARIVRATNPEAALQALIQSYLLDQNPNVFIDCLQDGYLRYNSLNFKDVLNRAFCPPDQKERLLILLTQGLDPSIATRAVALQSRLREIARVSQEYGARAVFVSYPFPYPVIEGVMQRVAEETDSGWLNLSHRFETLLKDPERRKRILKEGNFIDGGSQKIADLIAADVEYRQPD